MARVARQHEDEDTQLSATDAAGQAAPTDAGTPAMPQATPSFAGPTAPTSGPAAGTARQSKFQDISRLLYANQGQGAALANQAVQSVADRAKAAEGQLASAQGAYQAQAQAAVPQRVVTPSAPPQVGGGPLGAGRRTTTQVNVASDPYADATRLAGATYGGPSSLGEAKGVDQAGLQAAFTDASRAANALGSPTGVSTILGRSGGGGRFDDLLAGAEGGGILNAGKQRFGSIRDQLTKALGDTGAADAARAQTDALRTGAQGALHQRDLELQNNMDADTRATNAAEAERQMQSDYVNTMAQQSAFDRGHLFSPPSYEEWTKMSPELRAYYMENGFLSPAPKPQ